MFTGTPDRKSDDRFGNYLQLYFSCFNTSTICSLSVRTYFTQFIRRSLMMMVVLFTIETQICLISFNNKQHWRHFKGDATRHCAMGNVGSIQIFCRIRLTDNHTKPLYTEPQSYKCNVKLNRRWNFLSLCDDMHAYQINECIS